MIRGPGIFPGFDAHIGIECDGCEMVPITGDRHRAKNRDNFDLCNACVGDGRVTSDSDDFQVIHFPWQASSDAPVPPAPLVPRDRSADVAHLQKLLVQLGYLTEESVSRAIGHFGPRTRAAVERFQKEYGLGDSVQVGTYDDLTRAALFSIMDSVPSGHPDGNGSKDESVAGPSGASD